MVSGWLLTGISSLTYVLALTWIHSCWWLTMLFLVPLYYGALQQDLYWYHGLVWGFMCSLFAGYAEFCGTMTTHDLSIGYAAIVALLFFFYLSIPALLLFGLARRITHYTQRYRYTSCPLVVVVIWVTALWLFFVWLTQYSFFIFSCHGGAILLHPLLPLAVHSSLVRPVAILGMHASLYILLLWQGLLTLIIITPRLLHGVCLLLTSSIWIVLALQSATPKITPSGLPRIGHIPRALPQEIVVSRTARMFQHYLDAIAAHDKAIDIFIAPEDCMQTTQLECCKSLCKYCMPHSTLSKHAHVLLGTYRKESNHTYNTLYYLKDGKLLHQFDKRHTMPFTEHTPTVFGFSLPTCLHLAHPLSPGTNKRPEIIIDDTLALVPYICSELFLAYDPDDDHPKIPILALCSDKWTTCEHINTRMMLFAKLKALAWHRDIILIFYRTGAWITQAGHLYTLKDFSAILQRADQEIERERRSEAIAMHVKNTQYEENRDEIIQDIGPIDRKKKFIVPLPTMHQHTGLSARYTAATTMNGERIFIIMQHCNSTPNGAIIACYGALHDMDQIRLFDTMLLSPSTHNLTITLYPHGAFSIKNPASKQRIIASLTR